MIVSRVLVPAFLLGVFAGCSNGGGGGGTVKPADMAVLPDLIPGRDLALPPDMANTGMDPVGSACKDASHCSGNKPICMTNLTGFQIPLPAASGYCTNQACKSDNDCGISGKCIGQLGYCLGLCFAKGECALNNPDNRCFTVDAQNGVSACLPNFVKDACDPTSAKSCNGTGACGRVGGAVDDVGQCFMTCNVGDTCPPDANNAPQACYFINRRIDGQGKDTGDAFAGLACLFDASSQGGGDPDTACMYLNSCKAGYECDFYNVGGKGKLCKKLCKNGANDCQSGTCQNAFKLGTFGAGDYGLCL